MNRREASRILLGFILSVVCVVGAEAQLTPAQRCEKAKNKAAAKRALCVAVQRGREISLKPFDYTACTTKMVDKFSALEQRAIHAGSSCPSSGDSGDVGAWIDSVFNLETGVPKALSGVRFVDHGDGTVTDTQTGLMWERKGNLDFAANPADPHDADNSYAWSADPPYELPNGAAFTDFLYGLNNCTVDLGGTHAGGLGGHCDWRLPSDEELLTILDANAPACGFGGACIPAALGQSKASYYWSSTSSSPATAYAAGVNFGSGAGGSTAISKNNTTIYVRGVRGGF